LDCTRKSPLTQADPEQTSVPVQALPHAPQLLALDVKFTQVPLQFVNDASVQTQALPVQV
jgi:hypothetical protein